MNWAKCDDHVSRQRLWSYDLTALYKSIIIIIKYADFTANFIFQPTAVENLDPMNSSALSFLNNLGQRICTVSGCDREALFLFQWIYVTI